MWWWHNTEKLICPPFFFPLVFLFPSFLFLFFLSFSFASFSPLFLFPLCRLLLFLSSFLFSSLHPVPLSLSRTFVVSRAESLAGSPGTVILNLTSLHSNSPLFRPLTSVFLHVDFSVWIFFPSPSRLWCLFKNLPLCETVFDLYLNAAYTVHSLYEWKREKRRESVIQAETFTPLSH